MNQTDSWDNARSRAYAAGAALGNVSESVSLVAGVGRILASELVAALPLPGFDSAAMDGYAVAGPPPWRLVGRTLAGEAVPPRLRPGQAWEVATGAATPLGAEAVLPYERAELGQNLVRGPIAGTNIRRTGEEAQPGDVLVAAGRTVTPAIVSLAAALGYDDLPVWRTPTATAVVTGDELLTAGRPVPGQLRDAIGPALPGWLAWSGAELISIAHSADTASSLVVGIDGAATDLVLVSGSSSVGMADHLDKCLHDLGALPIVRGVNCSPGRTQSLWQLPSGRLVVGLPGNPLAALVAVVTLVTPVCAGLLGLALPELTPTEPLGSPSRRTRIVPVTVDRGQVTPCDFAGSAMLRGAALADALAVVAPGGETALLPLPGGRLPGALLSGGRR